MTVAGADDVLALFSPVDVRWSLATSYIVAQGVEIVADYQATAARLRTARARRLGHNDDGKLIESLMADAGATPESVLARTLAKFPLPRSLVDAGLRPADVDALQQRLIHADRSL